MGLCACLWGSALTRLIDVGNCILILDRTFWMLTLDRTERRVELSTNIDCLKRIYWCECKCLCVPCYTCRPQRITSESVFPLFLYVGSRTGIHMKGSTANVFPRSLAALRNSALWPGMECDQLSQTPIPVVSLPWWTVARNCEPNKSSLRQAAVEIVFITAAGKDI